MANYIAEVVVSLKPVVNDPQGLVVRDGLHHLGFAAVNAVRVGKNIEIDVAADNEAAAHAAVMQMCDKLLCNPVIEDYRIRLRSTADA